MNDSKRLIQIKLADNSYNEFKTLKDEVGLTTFTELIKYSFVLFKWVIKMQKKGFEIYAIPIDDDGEKGEKVQLLIPV